MQLVSKLVQTATDDAYIVFDLPDCALCPVIVRFHDEERCIENDGFESDRISIYLLQGMRWCTFGFFQL